MNHNPPEMFKQGINVLMLIDRGIQNSNKGSKRWINKIITDSEENWDKAVQKLIELQAHINEPAVRLYSSINPRSLKKGIKTFQHKQLDLTEDNEATFYRRINDSFCSCLMKPENRDRSLFLLDVDSKDTSEADAFLISNSGIMQYYSYPTPNGWHYIVEPFDLRMCEDAETFEVKRDALMLISWVDKL